MRRFELVRQNEHSRVVARGEEFGTGGVALEWVGGDMETWSSLGAMFDQHCADGRTIVRPESPISRDP